MPTPRLVIADLEQGSKKWLEWRNTVIGASDGLRAQGMSKALYEQKIGLKDVVNFENAAMARGTKLEEDAREMFEMEHMREISPLCGRRAHIAASGDGVDRKAKDGIEIKCPSKTEIHSKHIEGFIEPAYRHQMQQVMYVFGLKQMYFISYMPGHETPYHEELVVRDAKYITSMVKGLNKFWARVEARQWPDSAEEIGTAIAEASTGEALPALVEVSISAPMKKLVQDTVSAAKNMKVSTEEEAQSAADILKGASNLKKKVDEARLDTVRPHNDYVSGINAKFKPLIEEIDKVFNGLKLKVADYLTSNDETKVQGEVGKVAVRAGSLAYKVDDIKKVPKKFLKEVVDDALIKAELKAGNDVKGITVTTKRTIVAS